MLGKIQSFCRLLISFQNQLLWKVLSVLQSDCQTVFDPDQARHFVGPSLGPNCLHMSSADDTIGGKALKGYLILAFYEARKCKMFLRNLFILLIYIYLNNNCLSEKPGIYLLLLSLLTTEQDRLCWLKNCHFGSNLRLQITVFKVCSIRLVCSCLLCQFLCQ